MVFDNSRIRRDETLVLEARGSQSRSTLKEKRDWKNAAIWYRFVSEFWLVLGAILAQKSTNERSKNQSDFGVGFDGQKWGEVSVDTRADAGPLDEAAVECLKSRNYTKKSKTPCSLQAGAADLKASPLPPAPSAVAGLI